MAMAPGGERWRKEAIFDIMDGKNGNLLNMLTQDPELKTWKSKQGGDETANMSLLHAAVRFENPEALKLLLANGGTNINSLGKGGKTPFVMAIDQSEPKVVQMMLDAVAAGHAKMPDMTKALKQAEVQLASAMRNEQKVAEATQVHDMLVAILKEEERKRKAEEEAAAAAAAEAKRLLEEEIARAAKEAADAAAEGSLDHRRLEVAALSAAHRVRRPVDALRRDRRRTRRRRGRHHRHLLCASHLRHRPARSLLHLSMQAPGRLLLVLV